MLQEPLQGEPMSRRFAWCCTASTILGLQLSSKTKAHLADEGPASLTTATQALAVFLSAFKRRCEAQIRLFCSTSAMGGEDQPLRELSPAQVHLRT
jgi:hypothetical protein